MFDIKPKQLGITLVALIVALMASDFVIHQVLMKNDYGATAELWRGEESMKLPFMMAGQILSALVFGMLYARGFASGNWSCALIYGLMIGLIGTATSMVYYSVMPMPGSLALKWSLFGIAQGLLLAAVAKTLYGRGPIDKSVLPS